MHACAYVRSFVLVTCLLYLHYMQCVHADVYVLGFVTIAVSQTASEGTHLGHHKLRDQRKTICIYE